MSSVAEMEITALSLPSPLGSVETVTEVADTHVWRITHSKTMGVSIVGSEST